MKLITIVERKTVKRSACVLLALLLAISPLNPALDIRAARAETLEHSALIDSYSINTELVQGDAEYTIDLWICDGSFTQTTSISSPYVIPADTSAFTFDKQLGFDSSSLPFNDETKGVDFHLNISGAKHLVGDTLSVFFGFAVDGDSYCNVVSCYVEEVNHRVPKQEGRIKEYVLPEKDKGVTADSTELPSTSEDENAVNDARVMDAQRWLNERYSGRSGYTPLEVDGHAGFLTMMAFVVGLQIDLDIPNPTGIYGDQTQAAFNQQIGSLSQGSHDEGDTQYVTMIQHAMFCKGYSPGEVSGTFGPYTAEGIKSLKEDAGFAGASEEVNSMWMKALLNSDAYVLVNKGDSRIREAQQTLNRMYYSYFGIKPCDGHYSRDTNEALIYGWQCEEGLDPATATGTFGPTTRARCPYLPSDTRYSGEVLGHFIRLEQYALYFNQCTEYYKLSLDTRYTLQVYACVKAFSEFMVLPLQDGTTDVGTVMSLLVSTGNPDRAAAGCDCATQLNLAKAQTLYNAGYRYVGRYLTGYSAVGPKNLTTSEYIAISRAGLRLFPIYQDGNEQKDHFTAAQGYEDANLACDAAQRLGITQGTTIIYFAVDYDFMDEELDDSVIPYFMGVRDCIGNRGINGQTTFKVGIYGSRNICTRVSDKGLAISSFVSDMSSGYSGNYGVKMPENWAFDQFNEYDFVAGGFALDKDAVSGRDIGVKLNVSDYVYDRNAMRTYAEQWYNGRNTDKYHAYSADCANYASQCLHEGGLPMTDDWYSTGHSLKNDLEDAFLESDEVGASWRLAQRLYDYYSSDLPYRTGEVLFIDRTSDIAGLIAKAKLEGIPIQPGDLLMMAPKGQGDRHISHATVVYSVSDDMIQYTAHTTDYLNRDLSNAFDVAHNECYIVRLRNSWSL